MKKQEADTPWRQVADIGNVLRHGYLEVDHELIWSVAVDDLPPLKAVVQRLLAQLEP